jgi:diaminopimelate epimerase
MKIPVTYMSGAGNLFTVIDNREIKWENNIWEKMVLDLCHTDNFISEGLLIIDSSPEETDFKVNFFNPDGSYGAMCGNGGRCSVVYAASNGFFSDKTNSDDILIGMLDRIYHAKIIGNDVELWFPKPLTIQEKVSINTGYGTSNGTFIDVGARHFILNYKDIKSDKSFQDFELEEFAHEIRFHNQFAPLGCNVNIYEIISMNEILFSTYEKGVEDETGACGTGTLATALSANLKNEVDFPVKVIPTSKIPLFVDLKGIPPDKIEGMSLKGEVEFLGEAEIDVKYSGD